MEISSGSHSELKIRQRKTCNEWLLVGPLLLLPVFRKPRGKTKQNMELPFHGNEHARVWWGLRLDLEIEEMAATIPRQRAFWA